MTFSINHLKTIFQQPKQYFFFILKAKEKKKILSRAVYESNKLQLSLLERYRKEFPNETQQFYTD